MIKINNVYKSFSGKSVLRGVNLHIQKGESVVIVGKSGCGKTVLLKSIIGLIQPDSGEIWIQGENIVGMPRKRLYQIRTKMGMLFQGSALFDSLTVEENVALPLREHTRLDWKEIQEKVREKLALVGLSGAEGKKPSELSGGMRKRVGLARALIMEPEILLYDEPTTGLDPVTAGMINDLIAELNQKFSVTSVAVTHDMTSAFTIGERVAMLHEGKVVFDGSMKEFRESSLPIIQEFLEYQWE